MAPLSPPWAEQVQRVEHTPQVWIGGKRPDERLCGDQIVGEFLDLVAGKKKQAVLAKKRAAARLAHVAEKARLGGQTGRKRRCRIRRLVGCCAIQHSHQEVVVLRKLPVQLCGGLLPWQVAGDQPSQVGVNRETVGRTDSSQP